MTMIDELRSLAIFAETAKKSSFKKAATTLGLSPSVVSYHISELEKRIDCTLIYRSTRKLSLTSEGEILFEHANKMLQAAEEGLEKVKPSQQALSGKLLITLPSALTRSPLIAKIARFSHAHPSVELNIVFSDVRQDLINEGIDLAIRIGNMEDSKLIGKNIGQIKRKLVCNADFYTLQCSHQKLDTDSASKLIPEDIKNWPWIKLSMLSNKRRLVSKANRELELDISSNLVVDSVEAMTQLCLLGCGIATPPDFLVEQALKDRELIELLPSWQVEPLPLFAVWHNSRASNSPANKKVQRLVEYLIGD